MGVKQAGWYVSGGRDGMNKIAMALAIPVGSMTGACRVSLHLHWRRGGGIEPLHVPMPRELKSRPSTSPTHPGHRAVLTGLSK